MAHKEKKTQKNKLTGSVPGEAQMLKSPDKDFKSAID